MRSVTERDFAKGHMAEFPRVLITGASGYLGQQLMAATDWPEAVWLGRKEMGVTNYTRIGAYDRAHLAPYIKSADVVIHLAAVISNVAGTTAHVFAR